MIKEILGSGKENIKTTKQLMSELKINNSRELIAIVNQERKDGAVILSTCGNNGGYYLPSEDDETKIEELKEFIKTMNCRKKELSKSTASAVKELQKMRDFTK